MRLLLRRKYIDLVSKIAKEQALGFDITEFTLTLEQYDALCRRKPKDDTAHE